MSDRESAEENLRVIRSLMERVTTYRAISAPSALVAGLLSTVAAGAVYYNNEVSLVWGELCGRASSPLSGSLFCS